MQAVKNIVLTLTIALTSGSALFACGGNDELKSIKEEACACKDMACATNVSNKLTKLDGDAISGNEANKKVLADIQACLLSALKPAKK